MPHATDVGLTAFGQLTDLQVLALLSGARRPSRSLVEGGCAVCALELKLLPHTPVSVHNFNAETTPPCMTGPGVPWCCPRRLCHGGDP
jgi:hypothetical protein